jgi:hypothetical protein
VRGTTWKPWRSWLLVLAALLALGAARARAQDAAAHAERPSAAQLDEARALFQRGVALADQQQFVGAAQRFREALAIHYAPAVAYNLAAALFELHQYEESFDQVQTVLRDDSTSPELRARAQKLEQALSSNVARLTVLASSTSADDVVVRVDGEPLEPALLGTPRAVAPGSHRVSAERRGQRVSERTIEVPSRTAVIVDVSLIVTDPGAPAADSAAAASGAPTGPDDRARRKRIWLWTGIAAGVVVLGTGVALAVVLSRDDPASRPAAQGDFMPGVLTWK